MRGRNRDRGYNQLLAARGRTVRKAKAPRNEHAKPNPDAKRSRADPCAERSSSPRFSVSEFSYSAVPFRCYAVSPQVVVVG